MVGFFIQRPIFASAIAAIMVLAGAICFFLLPVSQFPEITPPQVVVSANYPGASAQVVADTVTTPLEEQINGVEGMTYMSSASSNDGSSTITVTFKVGYPLNIAAVDVQNRVSQAASSLPAIVNQGGVTIKKQNPNFVLIVNLTSPDIPSIRSRCRNYAYLQIVDQLKRLPGVGDVQIFGERRYSMRVWLDPDKLANLGVTAVDVAERHRRAERPGRRRQDRPVACAAGHAVRAAGQRGRAAQRPAGILQHHRARRSRRAAPSCACATSRASSSARCNIRRPPISARTRRSCWRSSRCRARTRSICSSRVKDEDGGAVEALPARDRLRDALRHDALRVGGDARRRRHARRGAAARRVRRLRLPAELAHDDHSDDRHSRSR